VPPTARRWFSRFALGASCLAFAACASQPATEQADNTHTLYYIILSLAALVFIGVEGMLLWSIFRYRSGKHPEGEPPQRHGSTRMIVIFFAIGAVIVAVLFPFGEIALMNIEENPTPIETIDVQGGQWQWSAVYRNEGVVVKGASADDSHPLGTPMVMELPVDEPIQFNLTSNDVMHEFFVPEFFFMRNAMPGHPNVFTWTPNKIGTFQGQCAEYCGLGHPGMRFVVKVVTETDFAAWVKQERNSILQLDCASASGNDVQLVAHNIQWDTNCLAVTEGQPFKVTIDNQDAGIDHNFAIYDGIDQAKQFYATPKFAGVATNTYSIPDLKAGKYYFQCNIHGPSMSGVFIVKKAGS
jgi:cytochrome c oxidase subunit II